MRFAYAEQPTPERAGAGVRHRPRRSSAARPVALVLGDNIFYGARPQRAAAAPRRATERARRSSATHVQRSRALRRRRVRPRRARDRHRGEAGAAEVELRGHGPLLLRQRRAGHRRASSSRRARGEYEITDVNREYLGAGSCAWRCWAAAWPGSTPGRTSRCTQASSFIQTIEKRQGLKIAAPEEIA